MTTHKPHPALFTSCPTCHAEPGDPCRSLRDNRPRAIHSTRRTRARRQEFYRTIKAEAAAEVMS